MDQLKIGKFIAECRKNKNLTQSDLADKLGITNRAISKWETGRGLPDASLMLDLCNILDISVNDLLSGEKVNLDNYNKELENKLIEIIKQKEECDKRLLFIEYVIVILSLIVLFIPIIIGSVIDMEEWKQTIIIFSGFIPALFGFGVALKIEQVAGYYECSKCGHKYVPSFKNINFAFHIGRKRYLKCPNCGGRSFCKKVISK